MLPNIINYDDFSVSFKKGDHVTIIASDDFEKMNIFTQSAISHDGQDGIVSDISNFVPEYKIVFNDGSISWISKKYLIHKQLNIKPKLKPRIRWYNHGILEEE